MKPMTRGELARRGGVNLETIRYYEAQGLLPEPDRSPAGYRQYDPGEVRRLVFIRRAQELGFSLREIRELLALRDRRQSARRDVKQLAEEKLREIREKIRDLRRMQRALESINSTCSGEGSTEHCPILRALSEEK